MAKKKYVFDTSVLEKYAERLELAGGSDAVQKAAQAAMVRAKAIINADIRAAMQPGNLPAHGSYSTGSTADSLDETSTVGWEGNTASLPLGFDMKKSGITSILLMYGTPKMQPARGLREAVYGERTRKKVRDEMETAIGDILGGL